MAEAKEIRSYNPLHYVRNSLRFFQEVRAETSRVVWPNRKETMLTSLGVFALAAVAMLFLFLVDQILRFGIEGVVSLGGG